MSKFTHACLKCGGKYTDLDPDPYYCPSCVTERKAIAEQVNKQMASVKSSRPKVSELQEFDRKPKIRGFVQASLQGDSWVI